jgi:hypothetical protein
VTTKRFDTDTSRVVDLSTRVCLGRQGLIERQHPGRGIGFMLAWILYQRRFSSLLGFFCQARPLDKVVNLKKVGRAPRSSSQARSD